MLKIFSITFLVLLLTSLLLIKANDLYSYKKAFIKINRHKINLEVADSKCLREMGLMFRESLDQNAGMLFVMDSPQKVDFWMKNVNFPLDIVFINKNKIVKIEENIPVCKSESCLFYNSEKIVDSVIEFNAGFCKKYNLKTGQTIIIKN